MSSVAERIQEEGWVRVREASKNTRLSLIVQPDHEQLRTILVIVRNHVAAHKSPFWSDISENKEASMKADAEGKENRKYPQTAQ